MENYVTLFDTTFLPQGLALYRSLDRLCEAFTLWILCIDEEVEKCLTELSLANVRLLALSAFETPELLRVKLGRSRAEYCWTLTAFTPAFVFQADPTVSRVTYVDADLWILQSPKRIFDELERSEKSVLITQHAYHPPYDMSASSGIYCVQFMTFVRGRGETVRKWWEDRCIEWCFDRFEAGRFGDQKYLDDWTERFPEAVHVLKEKALARAPWNAIRFLGKEIVFFHFHGLRISRWGVLPGSYPIPRSVRRMIYEPYQSDLKWALQRMSEIGLKPPEQAPYSRVIRQGLGRLRRILKSPLDLWLLMTG